MDIHNLQKSYATWIGTWLQVAGTQQSKYGLCKVLEYTNLNIVRKPVTEEA